MTVRIYQVHMEGGEEHEHIAEVAWVNVADPNEKGTSSRSGIVQWLEEAPSHRAIVSDGMSSVEVGVVNATPKYLRTHADGKWTNNLLALPRY